MDLEILSKPMPAIEEWFLARVEEPVPPTEDLLAVLKAVGQDPENRPSADSWAEQLHERLKKDHDLAHGVDLVERRVSWMQGKPEAEIRQASERLLLDLFSRENTGRNFVAGAGFKEAVPASVCFRRLRLLMDLKPGAFCIHKSWGPGTIKRLDDFNSKVIVDFAGHPNHAMSYAFAAESLELPGPDHLLSIQHHDPAKLSRMVENNPAEVVRITLRSYGSMPVARLQQTLAPSIVPVADWKSFWDGARKGLLAVGDCEIPSKKLEPLKLIDRAAAPADRWIQRLREERRLDILTGFFEDLVSDRDRPRGNQAFDALLREKMGGVLYGAAGSQEELVVRTLLAGRQMGIVPEQADLAALRQRWLQEKTFRNLLNDLPVRLVQPFLMMVTDDLKQGVDLLLKLIPDLHLSPMAEAIDLLRAQGKETLLQERLRRLVDSRKESILFLCWMARNLDRVRAWGLMPVSELPFRIIGVLRGVFMYENLRAANGLKQLLNEREWLQQTVGAMDEVHRQDFLRLVREPDAPMYYDAQALLGRLIALFPELAAAFDTESKQGRPSSGLTSWRSYAKRQRQWERLINIEIPKNARDIEVARSYGDLRENHEYKTAKEIQSILHRRKDEMSRDLQGVKGTDFANFPTDTAGMGTQVDLEFTDGTGVCYTILGEWDQDPDQNIISCQSGLGKRLEGLKVGDPVQVPDAEGRDREARLKEIRPLPPALKEWVKDMNAP